MTTIFSRSQNCQEIFSSLTIASSVIPVTLDVLMNFASGVDPDNVYQYQTLPPLTMILYQGRHYELDDTNYTWYMNMKNIGTGDLVVNNGAISFSTDANNDPVFQYEWEYGDTSVTGKYETQVFGVYSDGREVIFEPINVTVRPRI